MLDRIESIHDDAVAAIGAAGTTDELEELRVRFLGRKAELPNLLRGVGELAPEERGAVGKRANEDRRAPGEPPGDARDGLDPAELDARLVADRGAVPLPGDPPQPV